MLFVLLLHDIIAQGRTYWSGDGEVPSHAQYIADNKLTFIKAHCVYLQHG